MNQQKTDSISGKSVNVTGKNVVCPKQWLVAHVHICHEKKICERLARMGIETYLPVQKEIRQWSDRRKEITRVLLPTLLFVRVALSERNTVLSLSSVNRFMVMRGEHTPAVIPDCQMTRFQFMLDYSDEAVNMSDVPLAPGEKVRVIKGPLSSLEGELVTVNGKSKIAVRLDMLGCACVDMPIGYVELIPQK